jgi:hypothetical protein
LCAGLCALRSKCEAEAALFFRDALAREPCCIESVPELLRLGAKEEDVRALLQVRFLPLLCRCCRRRQQQSHRHAPERRRSL